MSDNKSTLKNSPFGNPDGSRSSITEIKNQFVSFGGESLWGGLATKNNDLTARVIVGRKGSGKTVYLRCLQSYASDKNSLYADQIQQGIPSTENIVKFCHFFDENVLTEKWMVLWHRAILRSIISHLFHNKKLKEYIEPSSIDRIKDDYFSLLRNFGTPLSIYSQVAEIINMFTSGDQITKYLENSLWMELESVIADVIKDCPPICFYVDAVDEEFAHAPMYWHRCQKGLFYQTMRLLRDSKLGGRLHIIICIRDIVLSSVYKSEHRTRYYKEPHIRILTWDKEAIKYFFDKKISQLDSRNFIGDIQKNGKNIYTWLGVSKIFNKTRKVDEDVLEYLLRHTRLLPRDIVTLGNSLYTSIERAKVLNSEFDIEEIIRETISELAILFGNEQLTVCGNQMASDSMPSFAAHKGYSHVYTSNQEYIKSVTVDLRNFIMSIGKDVFTNSELISGYEIAKEIFVKGSDPFSVLWQNGLLGYRKRLDGKETNVFYSEKKMDEFTLPNTKDKYVFHSCLIDAISIAPVGGMPIGY